MGSALSVRNSTSTTHEASTTITGIRVPAGGCQRLWIEAEPADVGATPRSIRRGVADSRDARVRRVRTSTESSPGAPLAPSTSDAVGRGRREPEASSTCMEHVLHPNCMQAVFRWTDNAAGKLAPVCRRELRHARRSRTSALAADARGASRAPGTTWLAAPSSVRSQTMPSTLRTRGRSRLA